MVEVTLVGVRVELPTNQPIVLLKERDGGRFLPIWIGAVEATAIAFALQGVVTQRPMTHDLLKNIVEEIGVTVEGIDITELREGTFYAVIRMRAHGQSYEVSSRPSDAIALAVRAGAPIFAALTRVECESDSPSQNPRRKFTNLSAGPRTGTASFTLCN